MRIFPIPLYRQWKTFPLADITIMPSFTFVIRFRFDSTEYYQTSFDLALSEDEIAFVKAYLKANGDMPFWAFEFDNPELFNRMMEAHIVAILSYVNTNVIGPDEDPFTEETVSWDYVQAEFDWPEELLEKQ